MEINGKHVLVLGALGLLLVFTILPDAVQDDDCSVSGIVKNCNKTENGYVFTLETPNGSEMRCFSKNPIDEGSHLKITGQMSSDGGIFFVRKINL